MLYKNTRVKVRSLDGNTGNFDIARIYIRPINVYYLLWLGVSNIYRCNERKRLQSTKGKKQKALRTAFTGTDDTENSASGKFTHPSQIFGTTSRWHRPSCKSRQNRIHVLSWKRTHLHTKMLFSETSGQVPLPQKQRLINQKDLNTRPSKAWKCINRLWIKWDSYLSDKIKRSLFLLFFQAAIISILLYGCTTWKLTKRMKKKLDGELYELY